MANPVMIEVSLEDFLKLEKYALDIIDYAAKLNIRKIKAGERVREEDVIAAERMQDLVNLFTEMIAEQM